MKSKNVSLTTNLNQLEKANQLLEKEKNRVPAHIEDPVLDIAIENAALEQVRVANELKQKGMILSPGGCSFNLVT